MSKVFTLYLYLLAWNNLLTYWQSFGETHRSRPGNGVAKDVFIKHELVKSPSFTSPLFSSEPYRCISVTRFGKSMCHWVVRLMYERTPLNWLSHSCGVAVFPVWDGLLPLIPSNRAEWVKKRLFLMCVLKHRAKWVDRQSVDDLPSSVHPPCNLCWEHSPRLAHYQTWYSSTSWCWADNQHKSPKNRQRGREGGSGRCILQGRQFPSQPSENGRSRKGICLVFLASCLNRGRSPSRIDWNADLG